MRNPTDWKRFSLTTALAVALAVPLVAGVLTVPRLRAQAQSAPANLPSFEVASIKLHNPADNLGGMRISPGRFTATGATARSLISFAYNVKIDQLSGGPNWINSERYDIDAKEEDAIAGQLQKTPPVQGREQVRLMVQSLLQGRFKLQMSHQTKELPIYALIVGKTGSKLTPTKLPPLPPGFPPLSQLPSPPGSGGNPTGPPPGAIIAGRGRLTGNGVPIIGLVGGLSIQPELASRVIVDQTGLEDSYDFTLQWTPENPAPLINPNANEATPDPNGPSIFTALQEQLGLKLESQTGPVDTFVIDHIEEPSPN